MKQLAYALLLAPLLRVRHDMPTATIEGPMHPLTRDVIYATALRREIAKHAIACVLLYLRSAIPAEDTGQVVDRFASKSPPH